MHKPKPKYGWYGQKDEAIPNAALVVWKGEIPFIDVVKEMRHIGVRYLSRIAQRKPDPSRVPEEHFQCGF